MYVPARNVRGGKMICHRFESRRVLLYHDSHVAADHWPAIGAVAQLGERMTGSHEVRGSIPLGSTNRKPSDFSILIAEYFDIAGEVSQKQFATFIVEVVPVVISRGLIQVRQTAARLADHLAHFIETLLQ